MLTKFRALLAHHAKAALSSLVYLCRQPMATAVTIVVIAITLTLPALLWVFTDNMAELAQNWKRSGHISLYLDMQLSAEASTKLLESVQKTPGVLEATLKTPADGILELQRQEGMQDLMQNLPENPLPAVIDVTPSPDVTAPATLKNVYNQLKTLPGVDDAQLDMQWVSRLYALLDVAKHLTYGLILLLALAVVLIIGNTLRLVIHQRQEEIQVLKLIGASESFIMRPFLYSGVWYGFTSALLALALVSCFFLSLSVVLNQLASAFEMQSSFLGLSIRQALLLILAATFLGWLGACFSVKRQLSKISVSS